MGRRRGREKINQRRRIAERGKGGGVVEDAPDRRATETYDRIDEAIAREKALKKWHRDWKIRLIEADNPNWLDLYELLNR